ncbi:hypothetical protein AB0M13_16235 [Nocardia fluminea]
MLTSGDPVGEARRNRRGEHTEQVQRHCEHTEQISRDRGDDA